MAFEGINNGEFKTYLTKYGMRKLLNNNLSIKYFSLRDEGINYGETVDSTVLVKSVTGDDLETFYNSSQSLKLVTDDTETNNRGVISKKEIVFIDDCNGNEYRNIDATIYLGNYLSSLREAQSGMTNVANTYEPFIKLFDYVKVYEYTENAFGETSLWDTKSHNMVYTFESDIDYNNYTIFDNTHMVKGNTTNIKYDDNRFKTPFKFTVSSVRNDNGSITQNGEAVIKLYPVTSFGYLVDGLFRKPFELTESIYKNSKNIIPSVKFNKIDHSINTDTSIVYKSPVNIEIFRFLKLMESGITAAKNFFEFYGRESATDPNVRIITINMKVNTSSDGSSVRAKDAILKLNLTLDLTEANWMVSPTTSDIIKIN